MKTKMITTPVYQRADGEPSNLTAVSFCAFLCSAVRVSLLNFQLLSFSRQTKITRKAFYISEVKVADFTCHVNCSGGNFLRSENNPEDVIVMSSD